MTLRYTGTIAGLVSLIAVLPARAQNPAAPPKAEPVTLTLHPAPEPIPALKYRLEPERRSLIPGNAALYYHRAIQNVLEVRNFQTDETRRNSDASTTKSIDIEIGEWASAPLGEIPIDQARERLTLFATALHEVELGTQRSTCDWELDQRPEGISLLLGEIQEARSLARLVAVKARLAILDGDTDTAMHWIQVGMTLGRHVAMGPTIIQALVGIAIDNVMARCMQNLIERPGTPSLYWALADRPRPAIDMRRPLESERYMLEKELPELADLERGVWSLDEARNFAGELQSKLFTMVNGGTYAAPGETGMPALGRRLGIAAMAAKIYPEAKQGLIDMGLPPEQVERMPIIQTATLYTVRQYNQARDDLYKWMNLPFWQSVDGLAKAETLGVNSAGDQYSNPLLTLFRMLTPALNAARWAGVRHERGLDALQTIEAIRMYAAEHDGSLPTSLDALDVPAPRDPATGQPFEYRDTGDNTATLKGPIPPGAPAHHTSAIDYILKLAK